MSTIYVLNKDGKPLMPTTRGGHVRHMLMWPSGRWQRSRKPPVRNRPKVRILP